MTRYQLPERSAHWHDLRAEIFALRADDVDWTHGAFFNHWPEPSRNIYPQAMFITDVFFSDQWLGKYNVESTNRILAQVEGMVGDIIGVPDSGFVSLTNGGTESISLAVKTARDWARAERPEVKKPRIVVPYSAHPAFNKAAHFFGLDVTRVPLTADWRVDVAALEAAVNDDAILIVGSTPCWPHGRVDPIPEIAELAEKHGLWLHVDACVGGFLLPFYEQIGQKLPIWDFRLPGVRSMSADLHKFGFTPPGMSSVSFRDESMRKHLVFEFSDWPTGPYATESLLGTRAARNAAAAWATMRQLGREGYLELARSVRDTTERFVAGISGINDLTVLSEEAGLLVITSTSLDIFAVSSALREHGFPHGVIREPPGLHFTITPLEDRGPLDALLEAIIASVDDVRKGRIASGDRSGSYM
jgi:glutamate/tyrosine decarboxylase-like PLP-dependent enzyme